MTFLENSSIKDIIKQVENLTDKSVVFIEKEGLKVHAKVKVARHEMKEHYIFYNSRYSSFTPHLIAHECGHILRIFRAPPDQRLMPVSSRNCRRMFVAHVSEDIKKASKIVKGPINPLIDIWLNGIILQVTNYPEDMNIESWIYNDYPELKEDQEKVIESQFDQVVQALTSESIIRTTPDEVFEAAQVMNYVFFKRIGKLLRKNYLKPFQSWKKIQEKGEDLLEITEKNMADHDTVDFSMINRWAEFLGVEKWFCWADFEDIPENYLEI